MPKKAIQSARNKADYSLLIDADMVLEVLPGFDPKTLTADEYMIEQYTENLSWHNTRLIANRCDWRCVGVTHEYYSAADAKTRENLSTLRIRDLGDGGCKQDKFPRDIRLLTAGLEEEPNNVRYMFYLAQTYKDSGETEKAIEWYDKRIAAGGWDQEVFYSKWQRGVCKLRLRKPWDEIVEAFLDAYHYRPTRVEPIHDLVKECRNRSLFHTGYVIGRPAIFTPSPEDTLFVHTNVYRYAMKDEFALCAYYSGHYREALRIGRQIVDEKRYPASEEKRLLGNLQFYQSKAS